MDLSKFKTSDWLMVGGGALFLIAGFLPWFSLGGFATQNAFNFFFTGTVPWLLVVAVGVLAFLAAADIFKLPDNLPAPTILLGAAALSTLLVLLRLIIGFRLGVPGVSGLSFDRGIGLFLGLIAAGVATAGAYLNFSATGGDLKQLAGDLQSKAKSATSGSDSAGHQAPPPPDAPPPDAPPPPNQ
jgi:hypothetical protein